MTEALFLSVSIIVVIIIIIIIVIIIIIIIMNLLQADFGDANAELTFSIGHAQCVLSTVSPASHLKTAKLQHVLTVDGVVQTEAAEQSRF